MTTYKMIKNASSKYNVYLYDINLELLSQSKRSKWGNIIQDDVN